MPICWVGHPSLPGFPCLLLLAHGIAAGGLPGPRRVAGYTRAITILWNQRAQLSDRRSVCAVASSPAGVAATAHSHTQIFYINLPTTLPSRLLGGGCWGILVYILGYISIVILSVYIEEVAQSRIKEKWVTLTPYIVVTLFSPIFWLMITHRSSSKSH